LRVNADSATGLDRFGEGAASFEGPLILVCPNVNARGGLAPIPADQVFARQPVAVVSAHQPDEFPSARREIAGRYTPFRPWLRRVLIQACGIPGGSTDPVAADYRHVHKPWRGGQRPGCDRRTKYDREEPVTSHG
jgi:hypothetical protein